MCEGLQAGEGEPGPGTKSQKDSAPEESSSEDESEDERVTPPQAARKAPAKKEVRAALKSMVNVEAESGSESEEEDTEAEDGDANSGDESSDDADASSESDGEAHVEKQAVRQKDKAGISTAFFCSPQCIHDEILLVPLDYMIPVSWIPRHPRSEVAV